MSRLGIIPTKKIPIKKINEFPLPSKEDKKLNIVYRYSSAHGLGLKRKEYPEKIRKIEEDELVTVLKESGYFANIQPGQEGELKIEADMLWSDSGNPVSYIAAVLCGLSATAFPAWMTGNYKLTVNVETSDGKNKKYIFDDSLILVVWAPAIFVAPFNHDMVTVPAQVRENMYKNLIIQIQEDGLLIPVKKNL